MRSARSQPRADIPAPPVQDGLAAVRDAFARIAEFGGDNVRVGVAGRQCRR
jgi:hypothetical protein